MTDIIHEHTLVVLSIQGGTQNNNERLEIHDSAQGTYPDIRDFMKIEILNLPYFNLLLVNSQLNAEYKQAACFTDLEARCTFSISNPNPPRRSLRRTPPIRSVHEVAFWRHAFPHHLTFVYIWPADDISWQTPDTVSVADSLSPSRLKTFRVFQRSRCDYLTRPDQSPVSPLHFAPSPRILRFLPKMPSQVGRLHMIQLGEGLRYGQGVRGSTQIAGETVSVHDVRRIGVYAYGNGDRKALRRLWTRDEVLALDDAFSPCIGYGPEALGVVTPEVRKVCEVLPGMLTGWKEKRRV
ncbi:hypothetical protein C7974DRAFT_456142 [Boeremia exigua]|uniref:uncharacterized protein n=1 Tax=Boeremia exigua TaxID=749465 RepID=UPI001E8CB97C|nr:uncharacterized protein C7974DRAFT_456142 [Boeremia exigua]KAH6625822.1 hypothetical protein C7974DRAFT_456142 [Boeremia exigua]